MQNLQLAAAHLTALLGSGQGNTPSGSDANGSAQDGFASLLDMVGAGSDKAGAHSSGDASGRNEEREKNPPAAVVEVKEPIRLGRIKPKNAAETAIRYVSKKAEPMRPAATSPKPEKNAGEENNAPAVNTDKAVAVAQTKTAYEGEEVGLRDKLQEKITNRIEALSGLMNILATLLAKANGAISQVTMNTVTAVQANMAVAGEAPVTDTASMVASPVGAQALDPVALLADTHNTLSQMQQLLQGDDGQDAVLSPEAQAQLDALNKALIANLAAIKQIFAHTPSRENVLPEGMPAILPQLVDAKETLKNDVSQIRELLQKLKPENTAVLSKSEQPTQQPQAQAPLVDALSFDIQPHESAQAKRRAEAFAQVMPAAVQMAAQVDAPQANANMVATPTSAPVVAVGANAKLDSNSSGQGGQPQQGQGGQVFALSGVSNQSVATTSVGERNSFAHMLGRASQANVSEQVVFHVKTAVANGNSKIHIQLTPEELGKVDIKLHVDATGKTGVTIVADTQSTLDLLQKDVQGLQKALADAGLKADSGSLNFNLRGGQQEQGGRQDGSQAAANYRKSQPEEEINPAVVVRSYTVAMPDGLDIKI